MNYKFIVFLLGFTTTVSVTTDTGHIWKLFDNKYYQEDTQSAPIPMQKINAKEACLPGTIRVKGLMKQDPNLGNTIEELQKTTCTKWLNRDYPERCITFDRPKWLSVSNKLSTKPMDFCIDQYEYPNQKGQNPIIFVNFYEAKKICASENKRLCTETEWTFACEGEEAMPYPYGYTRDANICVIDKQWRAYSERHMFPREKAANELDRLWQGEPSGSRPLCKSSFGVYDLTGNIDEWTSKDRPGGQYQSILKGGYWGPVRNRCRPSTRSHNEGHMFYQQGFRCCADVKEE